MGIKIIAKNKKAFHEFTILDKIESGISLLGTEVKSLRAGKVNLTEGWIDIDQQNRAFLKNVNISPYSHGNRNNHLPERDRELLLKKNEIARLRQQIEQKGLTVVPLKIYFKGQYIKVEIATAKGKKLHDKRESSKRKDADREIARAMKG